MNRFQGDILIQLWRGGTVTHQPGSGAPKLRYPDGEEVAVRFGNKTVRSLVDNGFVERCSAPPAGWRLALTDKGRQLARTLISKEQEQ